MIREPSPVTRSVSFAPLSPTSTRVLLNKQQAKAMKKIPPDLNLDRLSPICDESNISPDHHHSQHHHRRRCRRRNSDPSSDRPHTPSKHRRRNHRASRSRSPSPGGSDEIELLPDRFDQEGRYIGRDRSLSRSGAGSGGDQQQQEMVEKIVTGVGQVLDGRATWKDLLLGVVPELLGSGSGSEGGGGGGERRSRRKRGYDR